MTIKQSSIAKWDKNMKKAYYYHTLTKHDCNIYIPLEQLYNPLVVMQSPHIFFWHHSFYYMVQ